MMNTDTNRSPGRSALHHGRLLAKAGVLISLAASGGPAIGQVPDGPPEVEPTPFGFIEPRDLGEGIIPPFNAADPGSSLLAVGQAAELMIVMSRPDGRDVQWTKDGQDLPGKTGTGIHIPVVSAQDSGLYWVNVTFNGTTTSSFEVAFEVRILSEIDDDLASWSHRFFSLEETDDPSVSGGDADPDHDGLSNLVEYFFGSNPTRSNAPPELAIRQSIDSTVSFTYSRTQERTDIVHTVQGSDNLSEWIPLTVTRTMVTPIDEVTETVAVEVEWPFEAAYPRFLRLVIDPVGP